MKAISIQSDVDARGSVLDHCIADAVQRHAEQAGALLPVLHTVQDRLGHIPKEAIALIAQALNLSRADVHGVVSYYPHFRSRPSGRLHIQVCLAEACLAQDAQTLAAAAQRIAGCALHETSEDDAVTLEPVYCLGLCATGPAIMVNDRPHARVTVDSLRALIDRARGSSDASSGGSGPISAPAGDLSGAGQ
jgi:NADH:ubiquinone oxidoreductase subunit E